QWLHLAHMIWTWRQTPAADRPFGYSVYRTTWPLFRLAQHLGLCAEDVSGLDRNSLDNAISLIGSMDKHRRGFIWLRAYEHHYREQLFNAVVNNRGRGRWKTREHRPDAQVVFCMDDREEGMRRHLEEHNPNIETLGAAGFFGVPINWQGLDDEHITPLCPVVVTPAHHIDEVVQDDALYKGKQHRQRRQWRNKIKDLIFQSTRRNIITSSIVIAVSAPLSLLTMLGKVFTPYYIGQFNNYLRQRFDLQVPTQIKLNAEDVGVDATIENPRKGFTDQEQADKVFGFLRTIGLKKGFAPFAVMMGHGSGSQNNPHMAAYDCGACSGRHGGPNARVFAAMANRPEIRKLLVERGITIPEDTWFLGAEHNTCDEEITWYDLDHVPDSMQAGLNKLQQDLHIATLGSAHERARRLASAPKNPRPQQALQHMMGRSMDFSQARPELGHATNAAAIIGRRSISQGAFFDRRVFLISYDPTQDEEGLVIEAILLAAGPVGAGINLEYYFSTVNNDEYGCGTKVTHNITGLLGVMDGTCSDLRTGLPKQMIEIHEAMRLQVLVEAKIETLTKIYMRQPPLQQLVGNGWLLLSAIDPDTGEITVFKPEQGFVKWDGKQETLTTVKKSPDWYRGHSEPLMPALIEQEVAGA
ncbi:MAG: DUF2309 domain-containing protein, partial [Gammaproteobacteria bacterium]|nr:DUF2309 domain-containing protein [Gammaproteobacteria bacterium]